MPARDRGFTRVNPGQRKGPNRRPGRADDTSNRVPGAPIIPRAKSGPSPQSDPYTNPPPSWYGPVTEWAVYYDLAVVRKLRPNVDFFYQAAIGVPGLNQRGFNRADFVVPGFGAGGALRGVVLNPISAFTHPSRAKDVLERTLLLRQGWLEIFLEERDLLTRAHVVVGLALQGVDVSSRARFL